MPPTIQEYLTKTQGDVSDQMFLIKSTTEDTFLGFLQTVSGSMGQAAKAAQDNAKLIGQAVADAMLEVQRIQDVTVKKSWNPFDDNSKPNWKKNEDGYTVTFLGNTYKAPGARNITEAQDYIWKAKGQWIPASAYGSLVTGDSLVRVGEFGKREAIVPLEQPSVMAKLGSTIASYTNLATMKNNAGLRVPSTQAANNAADTESITKQVLETVLPAVYVQNEAKTPLYVGTLIANDAGIRELEKRMYDIREIENVRRS